MSGARAWARRRFLPGRRILAGLAAVLLLLGLAGWAAAAHPAPSGAVHPRAGVDTLTITVGTAFAFVASTDQVTPGDSVNLTVTWTNSPGHTFTLLSVANYSFSPTANSSAQINAFITAHPPLVNITIPATASGQIQQTFTAPALGVYQYLCLIPGHFQAGMYGLLGSGVSPAPSTSTGPGAPVFIITGTIVGLVVLAIVLGFVIGRRRGSTDEMPPERLGYPEPPGPAEPKP